MKEDAPGVRDQFLVGARPSIGDRLIEVGVKLDSGVFFDCVGE